MVKKDKYINNSLSLKLHIFSMDQNQEDDANIELEGVQECTETGELVPPTPGQKEQSKMASLDQENGRGALSGEPNHDAEALLQKGGNAQNMSRWSQAERPAGWVDGLLTRIGVHSDFKESFAYMFAVAISVSACLLILSLHHSLY